MKYKAVLKKDGSRPAWWRWKNFSPREISCNCCGEIWADDGEQPPLWFFESMDAIQELRDKLGRPLVLTCAHRCAKHNADVGGVANSKHLQIAFDCVCPPEEQYRFAELAKACGFEFALSYGPRGFVHVDIWKRS